MKPIRAAAILLGLLVPTGTGLALAAEAPPPAPVTPLEGVDVVVTPRDPKVVSAFPSDGTPVQSGLVILRITFDQPMTADAWAYARSGEGDFPSCLARPRLLNDRRSFALLCSVRGRSTYAMEINAAPGFVSASGRAAAPYVLKFTTGESPTSTLHDALKQAGLTDADAPIMDWKGTSGISNRAPAPLDP